MPRKYIYFFKLIRAIPLFLKLSISSLKFRKPTGFNGKFSLSLRMGCAGLMCFVEKTKHLIEFSTTSRQQKEIIFYFVKMSKLIEDAFDKKLLTPESFSEIILKKKKSKNSIIQEIIKIVFFIKELIPSKSYYDKFLENILKTWNTHKIRDVKGEPEVRVSIDKALKSAEDRGSFYFLALIYALNPNNLNLKSEKVVSIAGSWFQIIDDYSDIKKDIDKKNTPFTISQEKSFRGFEQYIKNYQKQIQVFINRGHPLIKFMGDVSILWPLMSSIFDWHHN